jgi:drug/metabolite transporter (DMT)-like permease
VRRADTLRLVALAALWGASFLFMRIAAPALGAPTTAELRLLIAGVALALYFRAVGFDWQGRRWWRAYAGIGLINSGLPFLLWAYAALSLPAGVLAVLNATAPMWGAVLSAAFTGERLTLQRAAGLALGIVGVALVTGADLEAPSALLPVLAGLTAAFCYGLAALVLRRWATHLPPRGLAAGTQLAAALMLLPLAVALPPTEAPGPGVVAAVLALGLACGALAYLLYFRLVADIGAAGALTVTYLIPVFGVLLGALFLGERIGAGSLAGTALVVVGTFFVLRK